MKTSRFISLLLCVVMIMSLFTGLAGSASADDFITHEVQSGEILMKICEKYGLNYYNSKNAIMQLNGFTSETQLARLSVGQKLKLPASGAAAGTVTATTATVGAAALATTAYAAGTATGGSVAFYLVPYTVQPGDTLNKICNEVGSNYYFYSPVIQGINALANPNQIKPGQVLLIPTASPTGASTAVGSHVVKAGETITSIANQYGINYQAQRQLINGLNRRDNMDKIYVGQTVLIPGAAAAAGTTGVTTTTGTAAATTAAATAATTGSYQISVTGATNGSPYVIVNNVQYASSANAGTTVNIVPAPKAGYAVRDIQVIRTDSGTDVPIANYAFTMPNSSVQVTVFYSRGFVINKVASPYGTFDTMIYGTNASTAFYGDEVALAFYPKRGYNVKLDKGVYYQKNDLSVERVYVTPDPEDGLYKFKMPNYEIRLTVEYQITEYYNLYHYIPGGGGTVRFFVDGVQTDRAMEGQTVTMQMVPNSGWIFDNIAYEDETGTGLPHLRTLIKDGKITKVNGTTYRFVMDNRSIDSGLVKFVDHNAHKIRADVKGGHGGLTFQLVDSSFNVISKDITSAQPGSLVQVSFNPNNKFKFDSADPLYGTDFLKTNSTQVDWVDLSKFVFKMPAKDVTIVTRFVKDDSRVYYDLKLKYNSAQGMAFAKDEDSGADTPITKGYAGQHFKLEVSAKDNLRVVGIKRSWEGHEEWLLFTVGKTVTIPNLVKQSKTETFEIIFEEYKEYTTVGDNVYRENTFTAADITPPSNAQIELIDVPVGQKIKIGDTITFRTRVKTTGYSVSEVWKIGGWGVMMLAPTEEGGDTYTYKPPINDKDKTIQFLAIQKGQVPVHYVIPEYTIAETGIINVQDEKLYTVEYYYNNSSTPEKSEVIGPVYGMGADLPVSDNAIKSPTGVKVRVTIPKDEHTYKGEGTNLYYQADTLSIRFADVVLDNIKILEDDETKPNFVYEFWYKADPLTDLNIMVNFKETGTAKIEGTPKTKIVLIGSTFVTLTEDPPGSGKYKGTATIGGKTTTVVVTE